MDERYKRGGGAPFVGVIQRRKLIRHIGDVAKTDKLILSVLLLDTKGPGRRAAELRASEKILHHIVPSISYLIVALATCNSHIFIVYV
jgi:hypothetical protein